MTQYREDAEKATPDDDNDDKSLLTENAVPPKVEAFMGLAAKYGLDTDMVIGTVTPGKKYQQTVEEEYQAYMTAQCSPRGINPLMFWEARGDTSTNGA